MNMFFSYMYIYIRVDLNEKLKEYPTARVYDEPYILDPANPFNNVVQIWGGSV